MIRLILALALALPAFARPVDVARIRELHQQARVAEARRLLDSQLPRCTRAERFWALLERADLAEDLGERVEADLRRARALLPPGERALFELELREAEQMLRNFEPGLPALLERLRRPSSRLALLRSAVAGFRDDADGARKLAQLAFSQAITPLERMRALQMLQVLAQRNADFAEIDELLTRWSRLWPEGLPALPALELLYQQLAVANQREDWPAAELAGRTLVGLARRVGAFRHETRGWLMLERCARARGERDEERRCWERARRSLERWPRGYARASLGSLMVREWAPEPPFGEDVTAPRERRQLALRVAQSTLYETFASQLERRLERLAEECRSAGDWVGEVEALTMLGARLSGTGRPEEALAPLERAAREVARHPLPDPLWAPFWARFDTVAGRLLNSYGLLDRPADVARILRETEALPLSAPQRSLLLLTTLYVSHGVPPEVIEALWAECERLWPQLSPQIRGHLLAGILQSRPRSELGRATLTRLADLTREHVQQLRRTGPATDLVTALQARASLLARLGDAAGQEQTLTEAVELARRERLVQALEWARRDLLNHLNDSGRGERALQLALEILAEPSQGNLREAALRVASDAYARQERWGPALELMLERDAWLRRRSLGARADTYLFAVARLQSRLEQHEAAYATLERAGKALREKPLERVRALVEQSKVRQRQGRAEESGRLAEEAFRMAWEAGVPDALTLAANSALERSPDFSREAQRILDRLAEWHDRPRVEENRALVLDFAVQWLVAKRRTPEAVALLERNPNRLIRERLSQRASLKQKPELAAWVAAAAEEPSTPLGALLDGLRLARPELGNLLTLRSTNLAGLQARLKPQQLLVSYVALGDKLYLLGLARERSWAREVNVPSDRLRRLLTQGGWTRPGGPPTELGTLLAEPLEGWLEGRTQLLVVPTGDFWKVPWAALKLKDGAYLGDRVVLSCLSSGDLLRLADGRFQPYARGEALALGPRPDADLPGAAAELALVPAAVRGKGSQELGARVWRLVHVATHARFDERQPLQSWLELADGRLTLERIHSLHLPEGCLVVLSACESGLGQDHAGSEPISLATAFSSAGAQAVVSSLWQVDDEATLQLFTRFYAELAAGRPPGKALQTAQAAVRERFPHPYYWAGFELLGCPE